MKGKVHKVKEVDVALAQRHSFGHGCGYLHIAADGEEVRRAMLACTMR